MQTQVGTKVEEKQVISLGDKSMVFLPLEKWEALNGKLEAAKEQIEELEEMIDDMECVKRFDESFKDPDSQEFIPWEKIKKELKL